MTRQLSSSALAAALAFSTLTFALSGPPPSGHWEGTIQVPGQELKVEIDLAQTEASGTAASPFPPRR